MASPGWIEMNKVSIVGFIVSSNKSIYADFDTWTDAATESVSSDQ